MLTALEMTGTINADRQIELDVPLPKGLQERVRVIVLFDEKPKDISETEWLKTASANDAYSFLEGDNEDIYTLADGKPVNEE